MIRFSDAESLRIECDERGFELIFQTVDSEEIRVNVQQVADPLYESVIQYVQPWIYEREEAFREFKAGVTAFRCNPDESGGLDEHFHSVHADLWDNREGK